MTATTDPQAPELSELFTKCSDASAKLQDIRSRADKSGTYAEDLRAATNELHNANDAFTLAEKRAQVDMWAAVQRTLAGPGNGPQAGTDGAVRERKSLGQRVVDAENFEQFAAGGAHGSLEVRAPGDNPISEGNLAIEYPSDSTGAGLFVPRGTPQLVGPYNMRLFVRNLLATGQTTLGVIPFIRESGNPGATGADTVAEGGEKPEVTINFTPDDAPVRKIAAWLAATYEILQDAPTLRSYIDARLAYMIRIAEEKQLLDGNGTAPNIKGIFSYAEVQTIPAAANLLDGVAAGAPMIENVDGEVDGVVCNPTDFWATVSEQGSDGQYRVNPFGDPSSLNLWGLATVRTRATAVGTYRLGAWKLGAQVFDREGVSIRVGDQHGDFFIKNKVAILAEERLALPVYRPDWFAEGTIV